ncbi:MAG: hypothetical protein KJ941_05240, partial [Bacteroidetes bacterium]|nr:hypothetical protein [Bacteroidota bacterium]
SLTDFCIAEFYDETDGFYFFNNPKAEKLIDDAVNFHMEVTGAISKAKSKSDFKPIYATIEAKQIEYVDALNSLA